jgi:hypothetical protein
VKEHIPTQWQVGLYRNEQAERNEDTNKPNQAKPNRVPLSTPQAAQFLSFIAWLLEMPTQVQTSCPFFFSLSHFDFQKYVSSLPAARPEVCWTSVHNAAGWWITPGFPNSKEAWGHGASYLLVPLGGPDNSSQGSRPYMTPRNSRNQNLITDFARDFKHSRARGRSSHVREENWKCHNHFSVLKRDSQAPRCLQCYVNLKFSTALYIGIQTCRWAIRGRMHRTYPTISDRDCHHLRRQLPDVVRVRIRSNLSRNFMPSFLNLTLHTSAHSYASAHMDLERITDVVIFSWLRHYATSRKVAGSSPDEVDFLNLPNSSSPGVDLACNRFEYQESS